MEMITQIKQKVANNKKIMQQIKELKYLSLERSLNFEEREIIANEIEKLEKILKTYQKIEGSELLSNIKKHDLDGKKLENIEVKYVLDKCIIKGEITLIVAPPGQGKSSFALSVANYCLSLNMITNVIYLDLDNSLVTLADRDVDKLKELYKDKLNYIHSTTATKYDMQHLLMMMSHSALDHVMIIFDSAKNFMSDGKDRDSNKDVTDFMQIVKDIRDSGATVIMLHHVNKPQKDVETIFAGAAAWMEDVSSLFMLKQNRYKNCFILTPHKERVGALCEVAYIFEKLKNEITECELFYAKETQEDEEIRNCIYEFIKNHASKPTYSEILEHCTQNNGYSKNKVNAVIQAARQHYWKAIKEKENHNRDVYILLDKSDKSNSSKSIIKGLMMFLEEKLDLILSNQKNLAEKVNLFLPNLEEEKGVMHFLEITKNTFNTYLENGVFVQGIHYIKNGKNRVFIPEEIIKLKQSGIKGKRKSSTKQQQIEAINLQLGIIPRCKSAR